ncbi:MAG TPA: MarR family transcriptional regulator [Acidimicrobiales bacterium]|jgi:MarR family transcriptional regulator for hemolysin|nr:MarR family transcriptional regulator [Acidimicrobiales bacterium]
MTEVRSSHELDAPPWQRFESTLMATSKSIRRAYDVRLSDIGLNLSEACLLEYVFEHGPMTQTQVAERIGMQRASAGTIIDNLSRRKLLKRLHDPADQRVWLLSATSEGQRMAEKIAVVDNALRSELRRNLSSDERGQLADMLIRLQSNLSQILEGSDEA